MTGPFIFALAVIFAALWFGRVIDRAMSRREPPRMVALSPRSFRGRHVGTWFHRKPEARS